MYRRSAHLALMALLVSLTFAAATPAARADEIDYYEDEYADDTEEADEADEEVAKEVPARLRYARDGFYLSAGASQVFADPSSSYFAENTWGVNLRVGGRFLRYWAAEFEYQTIPQWRMAFGDGVTERIDMHSFTVNGVASYPLGRFLPFLEVGIGMAMADAPGNISDITFEAKFGGGIKFFATENIALSLSAAHTRAYGDFNLSVGSLGPTNVTISQVHYTALIYAVAYHF